MISSISSQTVAPIPQAAAAAAPAPVKVEKQAASTTPVAAPYNAMKEKMETASQEAKESATTKASEAMHALASAESSKVAASSAAPTNPVVNTQTVTQAYQGSVVPVK